MFSSILLSFCLEKNSSPSQITILWLCNYCYFSRDKYIFPFHKNRKILYIVTNCILKCFKKIRNRWMAGLMQWIIIIQQDHLNLWKIRKKYACPFRRIFWQITSVSYSYVFWINYFLYIFIDFFFFHSFFLIDWSHLFFNLVMGFKLFYWYSSLSSFTC